VIRTRAGYAGGTTPAPTYHDLGDHAETIEIGFDPSRISYDELLAVFWENHTPESRPWKRQYMSAIFCADDAQCLAARESMRRRVSLTGINVHTLIIPGAVFHPAEDYHQKYYLRRHRVLVREMERMYPDTVAFTGSTAAARVNGYASGLGSPESLEREIHMLGLSHAGREELLGIIESQAMHELMR
jgi:peptide-methionine (S)-S-oxide reductase